MDAPWDEEKLFEEYIESSDIDWSTGSLIADDTIIEKPYAEKTEPVHWQYSSKNNGFILGINLTILIWSDGEITKEVYKERIIKVDGEMKETESKIRELQQSSSNIKNLDKVKGWVNQIQELQKYIYFEITEEEKQELIRQYVKEIRIDFENEKQLHKVEIEIVLMDYETNSVKTTVSTIDLTSPLKEPIQVESLHPPIKTPSHH